MGNKRGTLLQNVSYSFLSNLISTILGATAVIVLPKCLTTIEYGYYQLYLLYVGLTTLLAFGLPEGIYLEMGSRQTSGASKRFVRRQFLLLTVVDTALFFIIAIAAVLGSSNSERSWVYFWVCASGLLNCLRNYPLFILQARGHIKEYAISVILERVISLVPIIGLVLVNVASINQLLAFDTLGRLISFLYVLFVIVRNSKTIFVEPGNATIKVERKLLSTVPSGLQLMVASYASTIIVSATRFGGEQGWGISDFAQLSLLISVSSMFTRMINAVAIPIFPALRSYGDQQARALYEKMSFAITAAFSFLLLFATPVVALLSAWLPEYAGFLAYAPLLLPMCLFESKTALLVMSYCKSLREEKVLLAINIVSIAGSLASVYVFTMLSPSIHALVLSLVSVFALRALTGEIYLKKKHGLEANSCFWDVFCVAILVIAWECGDIAIAAAPYIYVLIFLVTKRREIGILIKGLLVRNNSA